MTPPASPPPPVERIHPLAPFRTPRYPAYWLTGLSANLGWLIQLVGASWLMTLLGGTPQQVALVQTAVTLPMMLLALPAGAIADALGRRLIVIVSQGAMATVSIALAYAAWEGALTPWGLLAFTFLIGSARALNQPGWQTMVTEIVPRAQLPAAISLGSAGFNLARSVGPAIGGAIVATVGAFATFVVNAVTSLGVFLVALTWKTAPRADSLPPEPFLAAMVAGVRYVALSPHLVSPMVRSAAMNFTASSLMALMPLIARDQLQGGPTLYGMILGAFGIGAVLGAVVMESARRAMSLETRVRAGFAGMALSLAVIGFSTSVLPTLMACALAGLCWMSTLSALNANVQMSAPRWVLSRAVSIYHMLAFGCAAFGGWFWGQVVVWTDLATMFHISAGAVLLGAVLGLVMPLREMDGTKLDPGTPWQEPRIAVDMLPRSGPILTSVEYRIDEADIPDFLAAMAERRRIRIRDGGFRWTLSRDIIDPAVWIERWKTPTWTDVRRSHLRRTVESAELATRIRDLHRGPDRPRVRYELVRQPDARSVDHGAILPHDH